MAKSGEPAGVDDSLRRGHEALEKLVATHPERKDHRQALAASCFDQAMQLLRTLDPSDSDAARALELARRAVQLEPGDQIYWKWLALAEYRNGNWEAAIEATSKDIELRQDGGWILQFAILALAHAPRSERRTIRTNRCCGAEFLFSHTLIDNRRFPTHS